MTTKDWIYLGITVASYLLAIIAGVYARNKSKINTTTKAGQALDVLGKLATNAVHEAEYIGGSGQEKREFASEIIKQALSWFGIKGVTPNEVNGAIEKAVNAMNLANQDVKQTEPEVTKAEPEIAENVPEKDIVQPAKDVTVNGN
ncbi:phage holin [Lactobacillus amylovorus]|uniref:phage holin n=1 Tax=Lactobacillus amylovorus TaxID=1604 RepID=UPI00232B8FC0|nr:phage holin [Lactobacillus amylovorus]MDB6233786.1 phage holin [Lactobacillus amylovorus]MDB6259653.1 phage holin [Lactobacillus amylovorus]